MLTVKAIVQLGKVHLSYSKLPDCPDTQWDAKDIEKHLLKVVGDHNIETVKCNNRWKLSQLLCVFLIINRLYPLMTREYLATGTTLLLANVSGVYTIMKIDLNS